MASAPYLDQYLESLENLPIELLRNLTLLRDLDSRAREEMRDIDKMADHFMSNINLYSGNKKNRAIMQRKFDKIKEYSDDKVQLSIQTYEMVDKSIRELDPNLARLESEIQDRAIDAKKNAEEVKRGRKKNRGSEIWLKITSNEEAARYKISNKKLPKKGFSKMSSAGPSKTSSVSVVNNPKHPTKSVASAALKTAPLTGALVTAGAKHSPEVLDMPVDPNEPTYCLCNQVSYGEMIGCDNPDCPIEWFHFACVKLTTKPKGKWFCPKCTTNKKKN
ncbi:inhibitor of growth protein 4-like [Rhopalosiphum maidis]|uniref:inhibitor of growth protein 4-like n=1 Tax=Rhopalosiphum maidis TaxID=43146 RepID=UPI000EFF0C18|nr:inhibitor of growth protein 4-like [Rhopalosiphum maidis]